MAANCVEQLQDQVDTVLSAYKLSDEQLAQVRDSMLEHLHKGLSSETESSLKMLPTFVRGVPNGQETGDFLALDLGGTNFRVLRVKLPGISGENVKVDNQIYMVPAELMVSTGEELFDHIADCIEDFLVKHHLQNSSLPLGFTFSFPCIQTGLDKSVLLRWTKGFNASGVVGQNLVDLLHQAVLRKKQQSNLLYEINIKAVINDTVGTMMTCAYEDHQCRIGIIIGTGTNACYMESEADIVSLVDSEDTQGGLMCINTEWGAFGENGSLNNIRTECDVAVDQESINPGAMIYEKMISGMYMGEVVRHLLVNLVKTANLFDGQLTSKLNQKGSFASAFVTQIEADRSVQLKACTQILKNLGYPSTSLEGRQIVRQACVTISTRAAQLCASGVAALVLRSRSIERPLAEDLTDAFHITVGVDGTVYKKHPRFRHILSEKVDELCQSCHVTFKESVDGSGKGAALVTAVACRLSQTTQTDLTAEEGG